MALPVYLAMTAAEMQCCPALPPKVAYMACHFSPYSTGLSNFPEQLPKASILIVNDRTPPQGHDPDLIARQLSQLSEELECRAVLLDLQRPGDLETAAIAQAVTQALPCPVGISEAYAEALTCPVFLSAPPLHRPLEEAAALWPGRELWLELALGSQVITVTESGSRFDPAFPPEDLEDTLEDICLCCRYQIAVSQQDARFTLFRTPECLAKLLIKAEALGITRTIGLYQELKNVFPL